MSEIDIEEYNELKRKVELAKERADKASGALEQAMTRLKTEFKCNNIEEAEKKLKQLQNEVKKSKENFERFLNGFKKRWEKII
jgi:predicted  nucleic acid-binding Zn-ribbon protein